MDLGMEKECEIGMSLGCVLEEEASGEESSCSATFSTARYH